MTVIETNPDPEAKARIIESIVAEHGSLEAFVQSMREYKELRRRLIRETPSLMECTPTSGGYGSRRSAGSWRFPGGSVGIAGRGRRRSRRIGSGVFEHQAQEDDIVIDGGFADTAALTAGVTGG